MHLTSFLWNYAINDDEWVGLLFFGPLADHGPFQAARIRRSTLKQVINHVANKRELGWVLADEANRIIGGNDVDDLVIEDVDHIMSRAPSPKFSLSRASLDSAIARLDAMDLATVDFQHVLKEVKGMLRGAGTITMAPPGSIGYFRARRNPPRRPRYVADLFAPPAKFITKFQRCNAPGVSMLYCCDNVQAALGEVRAEVGETVYLSVWEVRRPFHTFSMPPGRAPTQDVETFEILASYIDRKFTEPIGEAQSSRYKITAAFATLYAHGRIDPDNPHLTHPLAGVYYRSVADPRAENLAIEAKQAARCMRFHAGFELKITGESAAGAFTFELSAAAKRPIDYGADPLQHVIWWSQDDELERGKQILSWYLARPVVTYYGEERFMFPDLFDED
ncbi:RES family NAD+ phosphorylase [Paraburkholderia sp. MM5482-R1]|uniref:RES family NAD+ phosphorylase n=1 Tax=unclassified Paraburkholderia TaxID=2615204 RepID=UPI003D2292B1